MLAPVIPLPYCRKLKSVAYLRVKIRSYRVLCVRYPLQRYLRTQYKSYINVDFVMQFSVSYDNL